jgi:C4-dicarboxylate transporter DctM subunit
VTPIVTGAVGVGALLFMMGLGMPIGFAMLVIGFTGFAYLGTFTGAMRVLVNTPYNLVSNYDYCVLPLFLLMASICLKAGLGQSLFRLVYVWIGRMRGGLAAATIGACAFFAAASASSIATAVTMGVVAIPEMKRYNYDEGLATGCVAAGGGLGILIPPSGVLIIYGILTEQPISKLFIAGLVPGILLALLFILMIYLRARRNPKLAPAGERIPAKEKLKATADSIEMVLLLVIVIVGLIIGWFTPTEAGAAGALGAIVLSLIRRRLSWTGFREALVDTIKTSGMIFMILIGAMIFNAFLAVSTIPMELASAIGGLGLPSMLVFALIVIVYLVLGCFIDAMSMILLTIPIFYPLILQFGFDPIWFGVIVVMVVELAMISPPVGMNVYVISGIARDVPMQKIFKGILPFLAVELAFIVLITAFPAIVLFLPGLSGG